MIQLRADQMAGPRPPIEPSHGCFIAGGAIRRWFAGKEELSDVDVFGPSEKHLKDFLASKKSELLFSTKNADTYLIEGVNVQLIKYYHPTIEKLLAEFDFNVCQFGWSEDGIFATEDAVIGLLRGHLSVGKIQEGFEVDSLRRAFKYQSKGFQPCLGTIQKIANSFVEITAEEIAAQIEMSPKGGKRGVRFD